LLFELKILFTSGISEQVLLGRFDVEYKDASGRAAFSGMKIILVISDLSSTKR